MSSFSIAPSEASKGCELCYPLGDIWLNVFNGVRNIFFTLYQSKFGMMTTMITSTNLEEVNVVSEKRNHADVAQERVTQCIPFLVGLRKSLLEKTTTLVLHSRREIKGPQKLELARYDLT